MVGGVLSSQFFAGFVHDAAHGLAWASTATHPIIGAVELDIEIFTLYLRIIFADDFDEFTVTRAALVGHNDAVIRVVLGAFAAESDCYCHIFIFLRFGLKFRFILLVSIGLLEVKASVLESHSPADFGHEFFHGAHIFHHLAHLVKTQD